MWEQEGMLWVEGKPKTGLGLSRDIWVINPLGDGKLCRPGPGLVKEQCSAVWAVLPQDVFTDKPAVVTVGAGDEEEDLPSALHAAQPGLDRVRAGLQVAVWVPLHTGEVRPCILCTKTHTIRNWSQRHNMGLSCSVTCMSVRYYGLWSHGISTLMYYRRFCTYVL